MKRKKQQPEEQTNKKNRYRGRIVLVTILLLCLAVAGVVAVFDYDMVKGSLKDTTSITVENGDGTIAIADTLKDSGVIRFPLAFRLYARIGNYDEQWYPGTYSILPGTGYKEICNALTTYEPVGIKVTIPEGKQLRQIAKILDKAGVCDAKAFMDCATNQTFEGYEFLDGVTEDCPNPLEGYLWPDTYYFPENSDPADVITAMLDNFNNRIYTEEMLSACENLGYTLNEVIILASIVESEATTTEDRKDVADVFLKRLENRVGGRLQSCVTVEYAMGVKKSIISKADTQYDSPYNTYMYPGLPIGAICCPGMDSINAVLYHNDNDYYYFQSDRNGKLYFAATYQEHLSIQVDVQSDWSGEIIEDYNDID